MILLVPTAPEVPKTRWPRLWPGLVLTLALAIVFLEVHHILQADVAYLNNLGPWVEQNAQGETVLTAEGHEYLSKRPLLRIAPSKGDWDFLRLFYANFVHGGVPHLIFNLIGAFAGARLCATFIPFGLTMAIYVLCGSAGLYASLVFTSQLSEFIPHLGSSAGIFALMGAYYVYNFRYRTKYFFWFPSRRGMIALKTSWFFFLDVILLEIVLSAVQFFPGRLDVVDHVAHVVGFGTGVLLALVLRWAQRWPSFLQTRAEFLYWKNIIRPDGFDPVVTPFLKWLELLAINAYNDQVKFRLCRILYTKSEMLSDDHVRSAFSYLSPTFIRLHTAIVASCLETLLSKGRKLPFEWLATTPYDSVIRLARALAKPEQNQDLVFNFVAEYRRAHPEGGDMERKLELLMRKLSGLMPPSAARGERTDTATLSNNLPPEDPGSPSGRAKRAS